MPENEYDELMGGGLVVPKTAPTNEYDELGANLAEDRAARLKTAMYSAKDANPDRRARSLKLSQALGIPADTAERNLDHVEGLASFRSNEYDAIVERTPKLAEWLQDHDNAALSKDDVEQLRGLSETVSGRDYYGPPRSDVDYIAIAREGAIREGSLLGYVKTLPVIRNVLALASGIPQGVKDVGSGLSYAADLAGVPGAGEAQNELAQEATDIGKQADLASSGLEAGINRVSQGVSRVLTNVAVPGGVVKGLRYLGMAPRLAGYLGHGGYAALQGASQADIQADESGLMGAKKAAYVLEHAATEAGFTSLFGLHGAELVGQPLKAYVTNTFRRYLGYAGEAAGEALEENATNLTHDFIDHFSLPENENQTVGEAFNEWLRSVPETTAIAGIVGGGIPAISANSYKIREAQRNEAYFKALGDGVTNSKTFARLPKSVQDFLEKETKNGQLEKVYAQVDVWDEYWEGQGADPRAIAGEVTGDVAAYDHAKETGRDLAIPTAQYATKIAPTDHNTFFARELKRSEDGFSAREVEEFTAEQTRLAEAAGKVEEQAAESDPIKDATVEQLIVGGYSPQAAEDSASALGFFNHIAARWNKTAEARGVRKLDPLQLFDRYGLKIQREGKQTERVDDLDSLLDRLRSGDFPNENIGRGESLIEFLRKKGLTDPGGELRSMEVDKLRKPGQRNLVREGGVDPDVAAEAAAEAGYIPERDINALFKAIQEETAGRPVYVVGSENTNAQGIAQSMGELKAALDELGVDLKAESNASIKEKLRAANAEQGKEAAQEFNQELDESGKAGRRGSIRFADNRQTTITLGDKADVSTFIHEAGHLALEVLGDVAAMDGAPQGIKDDYQTLLKWFGVESRADIKDEHHEQMARGMEAYIMEGKAPSTALRRVFARLSEWLKEIYRSLRSLNVTLTPEVRGVFDRLLASDDEIAAAEREEVGNPLFLTPDESGMSEAQFDAYAKGIEKVALTSREKLRAEIMDELKREERAWWKAERERMTDEVTKQVNERKEYLAIYAMTKGTKPDGTPLPDAAHAVKLNKKMLSEDYGAEFVKRLPRGMTSKEGVAPEVAATLFGYKTGRDLVMAIANAQPKSEAIKAEVDAQMLQEHGDMRFNGQAAVKATEAIHGEERTQVLMLELKALRDLQRKAKPIVREEKARAVADEKTKQEGKADERVADARLAGHIDALKLAARLDIAKAQTKEEKARAKADKAAARAVPQGIPPVELFRDVARKVITRSNVRDINPKAYLAAARKASKQAFAAFSKKDYGLAASLKHQEILNNELFSEASQAKEVIGKRLKMMRRFLQDGTRARIGKAGGDYLDHIDGIMARYSFATLSNPKLDMRNRLAEFVNKILAEGRPHAMSEQVIQDARQIPYQELPYDFFLAVTDTAKNIQHLATSKNKRLKAEDDEDFDVTVGNLVAGIGKNLPPRKPPKKGGDDGGAWDKLWSRIEGFAAAHRKLSSYARQMDGGESGGNAWTLFVRPLNEAADLEVVARKKAANALRDLFKTWEKTGASLKDKVFVQAIDQDLTREKRLMVALNYGNEGNRERLGNEFNEDQQRAIIDTLDEADWALVRGIAEHIESYWGEIAAKRKRITGLAPEKVEAKPFQTRFGEMPGWYFPISYDRSRSAKTLGVADIAEHVEALYQIGNATAATTRRGHEEARTGNPGIPLNLSMNVVATHLSQVIHDLTHHEAIIDANRLMHDERIGTAILDHLGPKALNEMRKIVRDIAKSDLADNDVDRTLRFIRNGVSVATLGFNLGTAAMQVMGIGQSMQLVGVKNFLRAVKSIAGDATKMENRFKWIRERSAFMNSRVETSIREAAEVINQVKSGGWKENVQRWSYYLMQKSQQLVDMPTWLAAYESAQAKGKDEATAVAIADQAVRDAQGSGLTVDLAGVQRSRGITQLFTVFYSYFNTTFNRTAESWARFKNVPKTPESVMRLCLDHLLLYSFPAAMTALIRHAMQDDDEDEDSSLAGELLKEHLSMAMGTVVGLRELSGAVSNSYGYRGPAGTMGFDALSALIVQAKQGELDEGLVKAALKVGGTWGHLPVSQATRTINGFLYNEQNGEAELRPLLFGPPPKK